MINTNSYRSFKNIFVEVILQIMSQGLRLYTAHHHVLTIQYYTLALVAVLSPDKSIMPRKEFPIAYVTISLLCHVIE